jgi:hypothetical protein
MRAAIVFATFAVAAILLAHPEGRAQSAYDYPWCAVYTNKSGAQACYYSSYEQCMATMSGIGGFCMRSPYYREEPRSYRHGRPY